MPLVPKVILAIVVVSLPLKAIIERINIWRGNIDQNSLHNILSEICEVILNSLLILFLSIIGQDQLRSEWVKYNPH